MKNTFDNRIMFYNIEKIILKIIIQFNFFIFNENDENIKDVNVKKLNMR